MKTSAKAKIISVVLSIAMIASVATQAFAAVPSGTAASTAIVSLKTNNHVDPLNVDDTTPTFSWQMQSNVIGAMQSAYQIVVTDPNGSTVWDSGKQYDSASAAVEYAGDALSPTTTYSWTVTVWDTAGNSYTSEPASFETGFMDTTIDAWDGAQWIGTQERNLDATSLYIFNMGYKLRLVPETTKASFIFGADDFRLTNKYLSELLTGTENYIRVELDITDMTEEGGAKLNIYRPGYSQTNADPDVPYLTISAESGSNIDEIITYANRYDTHSFDFTVNASSISLKIDGTQLQLSGGSRPTTSFKVKDGETGNNYNTYPDLNQIGFQADPGQVAVFSDLYVANFDLWASDKVGARLFDSETGATYSIFDGIKGVSHTGNELFINGGLTGVFGYADPSYGSVPMLRTEINASKEIADARLFVTAHGIYEMYINGERVGEDYFNPGVSEYEKNLRYTAYDVTSMLNQGVNAVGALLGPGWWSDSMSYTPDNYNYYGDQQALLAKMVVKYTDGTSDTFVTNPDTWTTSNESPIRYSSFFQGERYDATMEAAVEGWNTAGFDASDWVNASVIETREKFANAALTGDENDPGRVAEVVDSTYVGESKEGSGSYIYDMGTNMLGIPQITIPEGYASEGQEVIIRYAEVFYPELDEYVEQGVDGLLMVENYRAALSTDFYTCKDGAQTIQPTFTYHGYRYLEITGLDKPLPAECVKSLSLSSIEEMTGSYNSSNELVNQLFKNVQRSQYSNFLSLPTDCPQRNERMGWLGDAQVFARTASYNADVSNIYQSFLDIIRDDQTEEGHISVYAPSYGGSGFWSGTSWQSAIAIIPYQMYMQTGNTDIIRENIDAMYSYLGYLAAAPLSEAAPHLTSRAGFLADWLSIDSTDSNLINNAVYVYTMDIFVQMANVIGDERAAELAERYEAAKAEWNALYIDPETGRTTDHTQASYATPLMYGVINDEYVEKAAANLVDTVENPQNPEVKPYTITTGFSGTPFIVPSLTNYGYVDDAYKMLEQTEYASWLYPVTQGATSIWERWNSYTLEGGFNGNNSMNSFNHYSLGAIAEWMYGYQLGITNAEGVAAYKEFVLQPTVGGSFTFANGSFDSKYGTIESGWTAADGAMDSYSATVPANTTATLYLPVSEEATANFADVDGITYLGRTTHNNQSVAAFKLVAGEYSFNLVDGKLVASVADGYVSGPDIGKDILRKTIAYAQEQKADPSFENVIPMVQESFNAALENAIAVEANPAADKDMVYNAWTTLMNEIHKLGFVKGDKTNLEKLILAGDGILVDIDNYIEDGKQEFTDALAAAKVVFNDPNALEGEVTEASDRLLDAMVNLRLKADKSLLGKTIEVANSIDTAVYTLESVNVFNTAKAEAEAIYNDDAYDRDQAAINAATNKLQDAIDGLVPIDSSTDLDANTSTPDVPVQGDATATTGTSTPKTGETAPAAIAVAMLALAGAAAVLGKKNRR
ncbi:MAG: family 78 glycoside hydrolase catalytic domain [Massilioclostridium sp.]|nr:family 78 glycoside hydrolase catalytic domain [Massilioclostridium sp.]